MIVTLFKESLIESTEGD